MISPKLGSKMKVNMVKSFNDEAKYLNIIYCLKEPEPCMIDSWAQGYVQTVLVESIDFEKNT